MGERERERCGGGEKNITSKCVELLEVGKFGDSRKNGRKNGRKMEEKME